MADKKKAEEPESHMPESPVEPEQDEPLYEAPDSDADPKAPSTFDLQFPNADKD